ncbi:response regulator transcription factor [Ramlibacter sp. AN1015]|uniref:response regulator transcription factor n=1 Tax=Ramlibacter sp. AN1015 TaxID=3133428 RepID=UPI0030C320D2
MTRDRVGTADAVRIVLADDHALVRAGIRALIGGIAGFTVVGEAKDGNELLQVVATHAPDVVLTDIAMPGLDGIAAIARIAKDHPSIKLVVLSMHEDVDVIHRAVQSGAQGYLMKNATRFELEQTVRGVMSSGSYFTSSVAQLLLKNDSGNVHDQLTPRQLEVLVLLAEGKAAKEIAFTLGLSAKTVDVHRARIMEKLNLRDLPSLTRYALRKGLTQL